MDASAILFDHLKRTQQAFAARVAAKDEKAIMPIPYKGPDETFVLLVEQMKRLAATYEDDRVRLLAAQAIIDGALAAKSDIMATIREIARKGI